VIIKALLLLINFEFVVDVDCTGGNSLFNVFGFICNSYQISLGLVEKAGAGC